MNMEDRLRQAFEQEAEHLHAPSGSPETAIRRGRRRRASNLIGGAALVVALIGGTGVGIQVLGDSEDPAPADEDRIAASEIADGTEQTTGDETDGPIAADIEFDWQRVVLETPEGADVWNVQVAALEDRFVAVANGNTGSDDLAVLTWTSSNGRDWSAPGAATGIIGTVDQVYGTGEGFVAVARLYDGISETTTVYSSPDGVTWTEGIADLGVLDEYTFSYFTGAASGNGTTVLVGALQTEPEQPPILFEEWGVVLEQERFDGGFDVIDLETGALITTIGGEVIYGGEPAVYDTDGNLLFTIPWEALQDNVGAEETGGVAILVQEGYRLEMDFGSYDYRVTDEASGELIIAGDQDELYMPQRVTITDPATGAVVLDISIDEFFEAEGRSFENRSGEYLPRSDVLVLVSDDGAKWDRVEVPESQGAAEGIDVGGVSFGPTGFVLSINKYGTDYFDGEMLVSPDGRDWELLDGGRTPRDGPIVARDGRFYSVSYSGSSRSGVSTSTNGSDWTMVFDAPDRETFYSSIAAGEFGVVLLGQRQEVNFGPPLSISKEGRTLVLDYGAGTVTVIDDATGDELTMVEFDIWDEEAPDQFVIDDATGTVTIFDEQGNELMTVTEEEGEAASRRLEEEYGEFYEESIPQPVVVFSPDGDEWFTASTEGLDVAWAQSMAVGTDSVVIVGESLDAYYEEIAMSRQFDDSGEITTATTVMTVDGYPGSERSVNVWVGTRG